MDICLQIHHDSPKISVVSENEHVLHFFLKIFTCTRFLRKENLKIAKNIKVSRNAFMQFYISLKCL